MSERTDASYFRDWEAEAFGYGYGSGESYVIGALQTFMKSVPESGTYDFEVLEKSVGPAVAWLLINALCRDGAIEYGTSPRYGWLTEGGAYLRNYIVSRDLEEIVEGLNLSDEEFFCSKDNCNCGPSGYDPAAVCPNPFWGRPRPRV